MKNAHALAALVALAAAASTHASLITVGQSWETDDAGATISDGDDITALTWDDFTVTTDAVNGLLAFDTDPAGPNLGGEDEDLLVNVGNIIVAQDDDRLPPPPNDTNDGATITFDFNLAVELKSIIVVDQDTGVINFTQTDSAGNQRVTIVIGNYSGADDFDTVDLSAPGGAFGKGGGTANTLDDVMFDERDVVKLEISMTSGTSTGFDRMVYDKVPSPGSAALLGLGSIALIRRNRSA